MTVISKLCGINRLTNCVNKAFISRLFQEKEKYVCKQAVRNMAGGGGKRLFDVTPSRFQYTKFKDDLHFYLFIGIVPMALVILYCNIFIGPATLTEIPEGYVPHHYEYYKHPIKRFFASMALDPQIAHETALHHLYEENERIQWREKIDKVKKLMLEKDDYRGIYYIPSDQGKHYRKIRQIVDEVEEKKGYR